MIVMLNGAFGAGKTTLAQELLRRNPDWMLFDPEEVGLLLWRIGPEPRGDFQNLPAWAPLVVETARVLWATHRRTMVIPMTLTDERNYRTIRKGFEGIVETQHFTLLADPSTLEARLLERGDEPGSWAFQQIERCRVLAEPQFARHLDALKSVQQLAEEIA